MTIDAEYLRLRSRPWGTCWEWTLGYTGSGIPRAPRDGGRALTVRTLIARDVAKVEIPEGWVAATSCRNRKCVNPSHLEVMPRAKLLERSRKNTNEKLRHAKIAAARRGNGKLTPEAVADIKTQREPAATYAERYGVHVSMVHKIWNGNAWADILPSSNPFAGLFTGLAANDSKRRAA